MRPSAVTSVCWLGLCLVLPSLARAEVTTFAQAGRWEAFGGTASDGKPVCGIAARDDAGGEALVLKWFSGDPFLSIQVLKRTLSIARHSNVPETCGTIWLRQPRCS